MKITERLYKIFPATFPRFHITIERWKFNEQYKVWVSNQGSVLDEEKNPIRVKTTNRKYMVCVINHVPVSNLYRRLEMAMARSFADFYLIIIVIKGFFIVGILSFRVCHNPYKSTITVTDRAFYSLYS